MNHAPNRIPNQYRNSPKLVEWIGILDALMSPNLFDSAQDVRESYDIDGNSGVQLDIIGRIVDIGRDAIVDLPFDLSEFTPTSDPTKSEFGDTDAVFAPVSIKGDTTISDNYFRRLIRAKIQKNNGEATYDDIIRTVRELEPAIQVRVIDNEDMTFRLQFSEEPSELTLNLINNSDIVPRPAGVEQILPPLIGF